MLNACRGRLIFSVAFVVACDRDAPSTSPDEGSAPRSQASAWQEPSEAKDDAETEPLDTSFRVEGGLSKAQVQQVINEQFTPIRECFDGALARVDEIDTSGAIVIRWVVGTGGDVVEAAIAGSRFGDGDTEHCIVDAVQKWSFPKPKKQPATVHYAFWLRSY